MKKMIKNLMLVAVAAMAFVGCQNDNDEMNATARKVVLKFVAGFDEDTRATFGEKNGNTYPTYWDGNEWVSVTISDGAETTFNAWGRVELPEGEETSLTAKISVEFYLEEDQTLPAAGYITATVGDFDFETGEVMISDEQQPMENAPQSLPLISTREYTNANITGEPLAFKHAAAYGKMTIPQLASINTDKVVVSFNEGAYKYTIRTSNAGAEGTLWFACPAFDVTDFTVSFVESGVFSYTKSVESLAEGDLKFQVGRISAFTVTDIEKDELTPEIFEVFSTMEYLGDSTWKFSNANGYFMTIPFTTAVGDTLVDGVYTGAAGPTDEEFKYVINDARFVYADNTLELTYDQGTWVTTGGVVTVETVDEQTIVSFIGYLWDPTTSSSFLYQGVYDPTFVPSAVEILKVSGNYFDPSKDANLWIDVAMSAGENYSIFLPLTVGEDGEPFAVIPEGVYTVGAETGKAIGAEAHANASSVDAPPYVGLKEGTLTVSYVGEEYKLVLDLTNNNDEVFDLEWQGTIGEYFDWNTNEFPHPGYVVTLDAPENVVATVENGNSIVVTWDAVANAASYTVSCPGQDDQVVDAESELTATFTGLEYETEYNFTIVAYPEIGSTLYKASDPVSVSATTTNENDDAADYNITLTKITSISGNTIRFEGDNSQDKLKLEFNPGLASIEAGTYSVVESYSSSSALEVSWNSQFNMAEQYNTSYDYYLNVGDLVNVAKNGDEYTITVECSTYIGNIDATKSVKLTYTGMLEADGEAIVFTSAVATQRDASWYDLTFTDGINTLSFGIGSNGANYWNPGTWNSNFFFSSGYALDNVKVNGVSYNLIATVSVVDGVYNVEFEWNGETAKFKGLIDGLIVPGAEPDPDPEPEPEPDSIVLTTITPLNETFDPGTYTWSFNFTDGTDNNKFAIAFFYNKASATSIVPGEYTFASELGQVNATNFALDGRNPYYFEGINKKLTTGSTVNVAVDGSVYTINMHFILSDGSEHNYKYVGEIVVEEPEPEPQQLDTPTGLKATPDVNEVTVSWSAVANAESYYVTCGDKSPQTVTTTTATFTDLTAGTEYTVTVVAKAEGYVDSLAASIPVTTEDAGGEGGGEGGGDTWDGVATNLTWMDGAGTNQSQAIFECAGGYTGYIKFGISSWVDGIYDLASNKYAAYGTGFFNMIYFTDGTAEISGKNLTIKATVDGVKITATGSIP